MQPLQIVAEPRRLRILELVWDRELGAGEIAEQFDISWPAISQHLRVLKASGLVVERRDGTRRFYRCDKNALGSLRSVVEEHWRTSLHRLKSLAEAEEQTKQGKRT